MNWAKSTSMEEENKIIPQAVYMLKVVFDGIADWALTFSELESKELSSHLGEVWR
jgi:hypothetical protein